MTLYCILEVVVQVIEDTASLYIELFMHVILSQNVLHFSLTYFQSDTMQHRMTGPEPYTHTKSHLQKENFQVEVIINSQVSGKMMQHGVEAAKNDY